MHKPGGAGRRQTTMGVRWAEGLLFGYRSWCVCVCVCEKYANVKYLSHAVVAFVGCLWFGTPQIKP